MMNSKQIIKVVFILLSIVVLSLPAVAEVSDEDPQITGLLADAQEGSAGAQYLLGFMYAEGQGIDKDFKEAVKWYTKAANQGHAGAQLTLGMMYVEGQTVVKDDHLAIKWYTKAAEQGNAGVQLMLASMHEQGIGTKKDLVEAAKWTILAGMNGKDVTAEKARLEARMTTEQIDKAEQAAKEFAEEFPNAVTAPQKVTKAGRYMSMADGFSVWFPSPPKQTVSQGTSKILGVHYQSFADNGTQYNVSFKYCKDSKDAPRQSQAKLLEDYLVGRAMFAQNNTVLKKYAKFKGFNAAQFKHTTRSGGIETVHEGIVFLVKGDFVSLTCVYPSSLSPEPTFNEYADTFELMLSESKERSQ